MSLHELIEVAGLLGLHATPVISSGATLSPDALAEYWIASRCRIDAWGRALRELSRSQTAPHGEERHELLLRLSEEISLSEPLARVVAGLCVVQDSLTLDDEAGPVGVNALEAHADASSRLRALVFAWWPTNSPRARHCRSLRASANVWSDALLGYLSQAGDVERFAHDRDRLREFAFDCAGHRGDASHTCSQLLGAALRDAFGPSALRPLNDTLNQRIAGAAIGLLPDAAFDGHGLCRPLWMLRAERKSEEAASLLDRWFASKPPPPTDIVSARWRQ